MRTPSILPSGVAGSATKFTTKLSSVRPESIAGSCLLGPSTSTGTIRPRYDSSRSRLIRSCSSKRRLRRSSASVSSTGGPILGAAVPGRGEYLKANSEPIAHLFDERQRLLEVFFGLAGKSDDDVGREMDLGNGGADAPDRLEIFLARVEPLHAPQNARRARLHGRWR